MSSCLLALLYTVPSFFSVAEETGRREGIQQRRSSSAMLHGAHVTTVSNLMIDLLITSNSMLFDELRNQSQDEDVCRVSLWSNAEPTNGHTRDRQDVNIPPRGFEAKADWSSCFSPGCDRGLAAYVLLFFFLQCYA